MKTLIDLPNMVLDELQKKHESSVCVQDCTDALKILGLEWIKELDNGHDVVLPTHVDDKTFILSATEKFAVISWIKTVFCLDGV